MKTNRNDEIKLSEILISGKDNPQEKVTINKISSALYVCRIEDSPDGNLASANFTFRILLYK